jgi:hypothetical protein
MRQHRQGGGVRSVIDAKPRTAPHFPTLTASLSSLPMMGREA